MKIIALDTNAFYHYFGRDILKMPSSDPVNVNKINKSLNHYARNGKVTIDSVVISEIIIRLAVSDKIDELKGAIEFIVANKINIQPIGNLGVDINELLGFERMSNMELKKLIIEQYLPNKVKNEVSFVLPIMLITTLPYVHIEALTLPAERQEAFYKAEETLAADLLATHKKEICNKLILAYTNKDEQSMLKELFVEYVELFTAYQFQFIDYIKARQGMNVDSFKNFINDLNFNTSIISAINKRLDLFKIEDLLKSQNECVNIVVKEKGFNEKQSKHTQDIFTKILSTSAKLKKNAESLSA